MDNQEMSFKLLNHIRNHHPEGLEVGQAAILMYGSNSKENRERIYSLTGSLRKKGYNVYSIGGRYYHCDMDDRRMLEISMQKQVQKQVQAASIMQNAFLLKNKAEEMGIPEAQQFKLEKSFNELRKLTMKIITSTNSNSVQLIYGRCCEMTKEEFINEMITYQETSGILFPKNRNEINVSRKTFICTEKTIPKDELIPLEGVRSSNRRLLSL